MQTLKTYKQFVEAKIVGKVDLPTEDTSKITKQELMTLEKMLDKLFAAIGIDVDLGSKHFFERLNDPRNKEQITLDELRALFVKTYSRYKNTLSTAKVDWEAVLKDINTNVNVPFVIKYDAKNKELDLVGKTIMRKPNFSTPNKVLTV